MSALRQSSAFRKFILINLFHVRVIGCHALRSEFILACCVSAALAALLFDAVSLAQAPARGTATQPPRTTTIQGSAGPTAQKADANLQQLMRGILYPSSNVIFAAQGDLAKFPAAPDASTSPNPLTSSYGGWQAVENAGLALVESANLLLVFKDACAPTASLFPCAGRTG